MIAIIKDAGCWMLASARRMEKNGAGGESSAALEALVKPTDNSKNELFFLFFSIFFFPALLCSAFDSQKTRAQKTKLPVQFRFLLM